jgi:hypothetical protein
MLLGASLATVKSPDELPSIPIRSGRCSCSAAIRTRPAPTHPGAGHHSMSGIEGGHTGRDNSRRLGAVPPCLSIDTQLRRLITNATGVGAILGSSVREG